MPERPQQLEHLEYLGDATKFAAQMQALIPKCNLLENFSLPEVRMLAHFMHVYRAEPGIEIINEGDGGDFMMMIVEGRVKKFKEENSLLTQAHMRDTKRTINDLVQDARAKLGENIVVRRFVRYAVGQG